MAVGMAVAAVAATGVEAYEQNRSTNAQLGALNTEGQEQTLQYQQKTLANMANVQSMIAADEAAGTTRGYMVGSATPNAIERSNFNVGAKEQQNLDTENALVQQNLSNEKSNVKSELWAHMFGDATGLAGMGYNYSRSMPTTNNTDY